MYKRPAVSPRLRPTWVQQQYTTETAQLFKTVTIGNSVWVLVLAMDVLPGSPPPPDSLLSDPMYLQFLQ